MTTHSADVAVIGAGTAGLTAERHARRAGARTLLIDPAFAGTTCATVGCMPSKLLIAASDAAEASRSARAFGVRTDVTVDGTAVLARVRKQRDVFVRGVRDRIADLPQGTCLTARARFEAPGRLALDNGDEVEARAIVIATGAAPALPAPFREVSDRVLTNENLFDLDDLPVSVGVIGAGPLGLEFAQSLHRLGVWVELFDAAGRLAGLPRETSQTMHRVLSQHFPIHLDCAPDPAPRDGGVELTWEGGVTRVERVLVAAGRPPNLDGLNLDAAGIELDDDGVPKFDPATMQCGDAAIFIVGDANQDRPFLHEAADEGTIAGRNAASWPEVARAPRKVHLSITFTRPEAALVGDIPDAGDTGYVTGEVAFSDQGRARVAELDHGRLRVHARATDGRLVGASLVAPAGEHLAHLLAWVIQGEMTAEQALNLPYYHPTFEEGLKTAFRDVCQKAGLEKPWQRDDDPLPGSIGGRPEA